MKWLKINTVLLSAVLSFWTQFSQADTQFRVIVDASGSMLISDPDKLTSEALRLISNLAPEEEATLGIWLFGEAPRVLLPEAIVNKETKTKLASYVNSYVTQDVKTDLESIIELLLETPDSGSLKPGFNRHWILVTDGMVDISLDDAVNKASRDRILNGLTSQLEANDIHLHTISMTGYTDKELLKTLSIKTDATHTEVAIPEDLLDTFDRIFTQAAPSEEIPFTGNSFDVDDAIDELTLVVFHENGIQPHVVKPNGSVLSLVNQKNVAVAASDHYTLITITKPDSGNWKVDNIDLARSSIRVITDLSAKATKIEPVVFQNEPIYSTVGLFQSDVLINDDSVLNLLKVEQTLVSINGETKQTITSHVMARANSQFKHSFDPLTEEGNYELITHVDGKTFARQISQYFTVYPAIELTGEAPGNNLVAFSVKPVNLKLNVLRSKVKLEFTYANGSKDSQDMPVSGEGYWEKVIPVSPNSNTKVRAHLTGVTQTGLRFDYVTPVWSIHRQGDEAPIVELGDTEQTNILIKPVPASSRDVMPVVLTVPVIEEDSEPLTDSEQAPEETPANNETEELNSEHFTSGEWMLYIGLNAGIVLVILGGILFYRRLRLKNKKEREELENNV